MSVGLERLEAKRDVRVDPEAIEAQLATLWREAGESVDGRQAVTRACLWNVVAVVDADGDETLRHAMQRLPLYLASRTLILRVSDHGDPGLQGGVSANCILAEGGGKLVCSEEVTLTARGESQTHLPSLARALLVPGVPTAIVFSGVPNPTSSLHRALLTLGDRLVTDVDRSARAQPLEDAQLSLHAMRLYGMDLGWLRRAGLREGVAGMFDPPATADDVAAVRRVRVTAPETERRTAQLTLGWIVDALGASVGAGGLVRRKEIEIATEVTTGAAETAVELWSADRASARKVTCNSRTRVDDGQSLDLDRPEVDFPLEAQIARALATRAKDRGYRAALGVARELSP